MNKLSPLLATTLSLLGQQPVYRSNHTCNTPPVKSEAAFTPKKKRRKGKLTRKQRKALKEVE